MQAASRSKVSELQTIMSRMPLEVCCVTALPEFGVRWRDIARAVRNARLPMTAASVARVLCRHVAKSLPMEEVEDIVARLRLKRVSASSLLIFELSSLLYQREAGRGFWSDIFLTFNYGRSIFVTLLWTCGLTDCYLYGLVSILMMAATQSRTWHVIELSEKTSEDSLTMMIHTLPGRITQALRGRCRNMRPEVQSVLLGDLMYVSLQLVSETKSGSVLFAATPPGQPVALVSSLGASSLLKALVEGLGYKKYENANLYGRDVRSLLRIHDRGNNENADHLTQIPDYNPAPTITPSGIDYTNKTYDSEYVDNLIGPDPPVLTDLNIRTTEAFFDPSRLNKQISLTLSLKSENVAKTLKSWVMKSALPPTSDFFQLFRKIKSNKVTYCRED